MNEPIRSAAQRLGRRRFSAIALGLLAVGAFLALFVWSDSSAPQRSASEGPPYRDASLPIDKRVDDLIGRMTLAEKVGQLAQVHVDRLRSINDVNAVLGTDKVGSILSGGGEVPASVNSPTSWAQGINAIQQAALERSRLKIPLLYGADAVHGLTPVLGATVFPQQIGLGATRDPALVRQIGAVTARGARAVGIRWLFNPVADIARDLRWGRYYETYGEDPALAASLVAASVRGLQGTKASSLQVAATAKHFIGYSQPDGGRDRAPVRVSQETLEKWFEPPFRAAVKAGVASVMSTHASVNGTPVLASRALLTGLLRTDMGFKGVLLSDWGDVESLYASPNLATGPPVASSPTDAVRLAFNAGLDVSMIPDNSTQFTQSLISLVESGAVSQARVDSAVRRVLRLKFQLGLFEHPYVNVARADAGVVKSGDRALARRAVAASITLLKNERRTLPLKSGAGKLLVVGPAANDVAWQMGGWTIGWQGLPPGVRPPAVTILQGIREAAGAGNVLSADWTRPAAVRKAAARAGTVIVAIGEKPYAEWYGDNPKGALEGFQRQLVKAVEASGKPIVLVLVAGRPLMITDLVKKADAFVMAYLPGSEAGHGLADVLFGKVSPRGKLPVSWPARIADVPMVKGVRLSSGTRAKPLFAYGSGLSYR